MIKQILPTVLACSIIFLASCSVSNKSMRYQASSPVIEMNKGACFGQCPIYRLSLYSDGTVLYEGLRFTDRVGIYSRNLTSSEQRTLDHNLSNLSWDSYKGYYESRLPDLQMITLSDGIHTVKFKEECPVELEVLSNLLSKYADSGNWEKLADHSTSPDYTKDNVTVQLVDGHTANEVIQDLQLLPI